jgi:hypothetical protein
MVFSILNVGTNYYAPKNQIKVNKGGEQDKGTSF